jgi:predicted phosphoribosyltransferase
MQYFVNRNDAALQLANKLEKYKDESGVVLAVPRGGVPIGYIIAKHLHFDLDLLMSKKLGHPYNEEFAIGAVGLEDEIIEETQGISPEYIDEEVMNIHSQLKERYRKFMADKQPIDITGKIVIVVDDGVATGRTILATLQMLRRKNPRKLIVAVPVSSVDAAERIGKEVDEFVCLQTPFPFLGVGRFYQDFSQTTDQEVINLLKDFQKDNASS